MVYSNNLTNEPPRPGDIGLVLNVTSVEHILTTALPLACYFGLTNKTLNVNYHKESLFYSLNINSIHINSVSLNPKPVFEQEPGTDKLHARLSDIKLNADISG